MNLRVLLSSFMAYTSLALIAYGLSGYLHQAFAVDNTLIGDAWKMIALAAGASIVTALTYPHVRGVRENDQLIAFVKRSQQPNTAFTDILLVTALQNGRKGQRIKVALGNGMQGEGVITSYGGTLTPASVKLTETEYFGEPR